VTITAVELENALDDLSANALDSLGSILRERARHRRVQITYEQAESAIETAPLSAAWARSQWADVGRVRAATRILISQGWLHPEQVQEPMVVVAMGIIGHRDIAKEAVAGGIADALIEREP
jgi:hypothetical protein